MKLQSLHEEDKPISSKELFTTTTGKIKSMRILAGNALKPHTTDAPAMLVCVSGKAVFHNDQGMKVALGSGDYVLIEPVFKHWIDVEVDSDFVLMK